MRGRTLSRHDSPIGSSASQVPRHASQGLAIFPVPLRRSSATLCCTLSRISEHETPGQWLPTLRVCKRWKKVITNYSDAWTGVLIGSVESVKRFLNRSGNQVLTVAGIDLRATSPQ
ncbi:hypothetical protein NEOLEDRAFT_560277 [Neolentinus lepideus HHB14362 ss-1]|uniref:F-box domain-containing protein n=1 Tax=Neolentinus lepideus HHB14362 ss-1 TaxID=1314782 RepID=A0A165R6M5_9AGAM|nr:hypothetical protein NEOLEDRAFT_560277 [Neolentinus lepideus HHB14362 ss-1]